MIEASTLDAIKGLVHLVLRRERECLVHGTPLTTTAAPELTAQLLAIPDQDLLAAIQRHRLEGLLHGDPLVGDLLPTLATTLQALARSETMAALALASLTRAMAALFEQADIPMLVIKGIPLSLQTTGSLTARGRGDLDLLVDPRQLAGAITLLKNAGFSFKEGATCAGDNSPQGHYTRFVSIEISLLRSRGSQKQWIDLHWHPSHARGIFPQFSQLWSERQNLKISGQTVSSLPLSSAFVHACCHAMVDNWMCLRNLVDVHRLSCLISTEELAKVSHLRSVRKTCSVVFELSRASHLESINQKASVFQRRKALHESRQAQRLQWRSLGPKGWTAISRISLFLRWLNFSHHPSHLLSMALQQAIPPSALLNVRSGKTHSAAAIIHYRLSMLRWRLRGKHAALPQTLDR